MGVFVPVVTSESVSPSESPSEEGEVEEEEEEELSSLFAQPRKTKLIIARKISKFVEFFIGTSRIKNSYKYTDSSGPDQILKFPFIPNYGLFYSYKKFCQVKYQQL